MTIVHYALVAIAAVAVVLFAIATAMSKRRPAGQRSKRPADGGKADRKAGRKAPKGDFDTVQDAMPLANIRGSHAFMKDGSYRTYLLWPGRNQSVDTEQERLAKAFKDAMVLASVETRFAILKYPEKINSSHQLNLVDAAIEREKRAFFAAEDDRDRNAHKLKMDLLETKMRESALKEALGHARMSWPTYLVFYFPAEKSIRLADQMTDNMIKIAAENMDNPPRYCTELEIKHLFQLYFTPETVTDVMAPAGTVVSPDLGKYARRYANG